MERPREHPLVPQGKRQWWLALLICLVAVVLDQASKIWAQQSLSELSARPLLGNFLTLQLSYNSGAAFSFLADNTWVFTLFAIVAVVVIATFVARTRSVGLTVILGLLGGGAIGNLLDRLIQPPGIGVGHVVDFLNYSGWFIGNVADIWIVVAVVALCVYWLIGEYAKEKQGNSEPVPDSNNTLGAGAMPADAQAKQADDEGAQSGGGNAQEQEAGCG